MFDSIVAGENLLGGLISRLITPSSYSDIASIESMLNKTITDYVEIDSSEVLAAKIGGSASTNDVGYLDPDTAANVAIVMIMNSDTAGTPAGDRLYEIGFNNLNVSSPPNLNRTNATWTGGTTKNDIVHEFGTNTNAAYKKESGEPWSIEEVCSLDYFIENDDVDAGDKIRVYYGVLWLYNIEVVAFKRKYVPHGGKEDRKRERRRERGFGWFR